MSANCQHDASKPVKRISMFRSGNAEKAILAQDEISGRSTQQLVWVLIFILLSLYLATSYVYWAKIESAWPIFR